MSPEEPVEVDPEVLADPLDDKASQATATEVEAEVVVPAGDRALAPVDPFRRYMAEVRRYPPLSREEEAELARRYRDTGDRDALFRLVTANLMLVVREIGRAHV